jgi:hypothetical protein
MDRECEGEGVTGRGFSAPTNRFHSGAAGATDTTPRSRLALEADDALLALLDDAVLSEVRDSGRLRLLRVDLARDGVGAQRATEQQDVRLGTAGTAAAAAA